MIIYLDPEFFAYYDGVKKNLRKMHQMLPDFPKSEILVGKKFQSKINVSDSKFP